MRASAYEDFAKLLSRIGQPDAESAKGLFEAFETVAMTLIAEEREACLKVANDLATDKNYLGFWKDEPAKIGVAQDTCNMIAARIRDRNL